VTLNVELEDVPFAILETVKTRILAQRRKLEQPKQPNVVPGKRPQFVRFGASSKAYRMPRPAAMPLDDDRRFAYVSLLNYSADSEGVWEVYSGNLRSMISGSLPSGANSFYQSWFVLPAGGENCILVLMGRAYPKTGPASARHQNAYVVSEDLIRQINMPPKVESICDILNPISEDSEDYINGVEISPVPSFIKESCIGFVNADYDLHFTPSIFEFLNAISSFAPLNQIKPFPSDLRWKTQDWRSGYFSVTLFEEGFDRTLRHVETDTTSGTWVPTSASPPSYEFEAYNGTGILISLPEQDLTLPPDVELPSVNQRGNGFSEEEKLFIFSWDWDDPEYCRQMCLALGFTESDLQP
jgi:hypothetical protein